MRRIITTFAFDPELYGLDESGCEIELHAYNYPVRLRQGDKIELHAGWAFVDSVEISARPKWYGTRLEQRAYVVKSADWYRLQSKEPKP